MATTCQNCESPVTTRFARVFGDAENQVYACIDCATSRDLQHGAAARPGGAIEPAGIAIPHGP